MAGVNKVILIGNLGSDPEVRYLEGGSVVANFNIATSETYTKNGEKITQTEWHRIELWDSLAKIAEQYLKKGNSVYIEGKLRTENWQDKEGNNRSTVRVRGVSMTLLGGRPNEGGESSAGFVNEPAATNRPAAKPVDSPFASGGDADDLPF